MKRGGWISAAAAALIALSVAASRGGFDATDRATGFAAWSDAFFAAGALVGSVGLLAFVGSEGVFDMVRYGFGKLRQLALPPEKRALYPKTYYDYRMQRRGRPQAGLDALSIAALCWLLAGVFLGLYNLQ